MSEVEQQQQPDTTPGTIPWTELATTNKEASKDFYTKLFGWTVEEMQMPNDMTYTMFKLGERPIAGCVELPEGEPGAHPMWLSYVNVEDLDASIEKTKELGGAVLKGRVDLPMGSFAVIADPQNAVIAFWQSSDAEC